MEEYDAWGGGLTAPSRGYGEDRRGAKWHEERKFSHEQSIWGGGREHVEGDWHGEDDRGRWGRYPEEGRDNEFGARPWGRDPIPSFGGNRWRPPGGRLHNGGRGDGRNNWRGDVTMKKIKMPIFEGEDAYGWRYRVERYFSVNGLSEREKLHATPLCLEGKAFAWYQWREGRQPIRY